MLLQAIAGKGDLDHDGMIGVTELVAYVEKEVPRLTRELFSEAQYPVRYLAGMDYPLLKVGH